MQIRQHLSSHVASFSHIFSSLSLVFWDLNQYQINQKSTQHSEKHIAFHSRLSPQIPFWDITSASQEHILLEKMGQKADRGWWGAFAPPVKVNLVGLIQFGILASDGEPNSQGASKSNAFAVRKSRQLRLPFRDCSKQTCFCHSSLACTYSAHPTQPQKMFLVTYEDGTTNENEPHLHGTLHAYFSFLCVISLVVNQASITHSPPVQANVLFLFFSLPQVPCSQSCIIDLHDSAVKLETGQDLRECLLLQREGADIPIEIVFPIATIFEAMICLRFHRQKQKSDFSHYFPPTASLEGEAHTHTFLKFPVWSQITQEKVRTGQRLKMLRDTEQIMRASSSFYKI